MPAITNLFPPSISMIRVLHAYCSSLSLLFFEKIRYFCLKQLFRPSKSKVFASFFHTGVISTTVTGLAAVRRIRHVHDMVRGHHNQPGPDIYEWRTGRRFRSDPGPSGLSAGARPVPTLHTERLVDNHQSAVRSAHIVPLAQVAQGPDQSQRGGRQGGWTGHHVGKRNRQQLLGPTARTQGKCAFSLFLTHLLLN